MRTIHKFEIPFAPGEYGDFALELPQDPKLLHVGVVRYSTGQRCTFLWAEVDTDRPMVKERLRVVGTGQDMTGMKDDGHLVSWIDEPYVWHLYALQGPQ